MIKFHILLTYCGCLTNMLQQLKQANLKKNTCNKSETSKTETNVMRWEFWFCCSSSNNILHLVSSQGNKRRKSVLFIYIFRSCRFLCTNEEEITPNDNSLCKWLRNHWTTKRTVWGFNFPLFCFEVLRLAFFCLLASFVRISNS